MQLSPDARWFWDGGQWRPAYSPDGAWRWLLAVSVPIALVEGALAVWMILLYRRYGTWARRRVPA